MFYVYLNRITDDDSSMRIKLSCMSENTHGMSPDKYLTPIYLADPGHRIKNMTQPAFMLSKTGEKVSSIESDDTTQYRINIGCCIENFILLSSQLCGKMKASIEYMFSYH